MSAPAPTPLLLLPIRPANEFHRERLETGLLQLAAEDPTLTVLTNRTTGTVMIGGMGEAHLEIVIDRLKREFDVEASVGRPQVAYEMAAPEFVDADGELKVRPVALEPVMRVDVTVPAEFGADVLSGLSARNAVIEACDVRGETQVIRAAVRLAEMFGYGVDLRERTHGRGTYSMSFDRYQPVRTDPGGGGVDRDSRVGAPLRPAPGLKSSAVALPEPDDDSASA